MNGSKLFGENEKEENGLVLTEQYSIRITEYGIKKCVLIMKREKFVSTKESDLPKIKKQRYEIRKSLGEGYTGKL